MTAVEATRERPFDRKLPPVVAVAMVSLTLAVVSGVLVASQIGEEPSLVIPGGFAGAAIVLEVISIGLLVTIRPFAWDRFRQVFLWALLAYIVQSGIIGWSFVKNDVPSGPLAVLIAGLTVFGTIVPLMIAFTVARYQVADHS